MRIDGNIAQFLLSPEYRSRLKGHLHDWMFDTECYKAMAMSLLKDSFDDKEVNYNLLQAQIQTDYPALQDSDYNEIKRLYDSYEPIDEDDLIHITGITEEFVKKQLYHKATDSLVLDKVKEAEQIFQKATNFSLEKKEVIFLNDRKKIMQKLKDAFPEDGKYIKSSFGVINDNTLYKGYRRGDLVCWVSKSGGGKTTALAKETAVLAEQGFVTGYAILGDNGEEDLFLKACSFLSGDSISLVKDNAEDYFDRYSNVLGNIAALEYPSGVATVREILSYFSEIKKKHGLDVLIVDYDANIAMAHDSLYESGGIIYAALKAFAQINKCVVIVASQLKTEFTNTEILDLRCANESSKKQHAVDMMIAFNNNPDCDKVGTMSLAKVRRGSAGKTVRLKYNYDTSDIVEIDEGTYQEIITVNKNSVEIDKEDMVLEDLE